MMKVRNQPKLRQVGDVWVHRTNLTPPLSTEVSVLSHESERSRICVLEVSILLSISTILFTGFCFYSNVYFVMFCLNIVNVCISYRSKFPIKISQIPTKTTRMLLFKF
jgi:hypothetical protein